MKKYDLFSYNNYKDAIKDRVQHLKPHTSWTLKRLADVIPVQYTFLSKVLNSQDSHLNEDHLFRAAEALNFLPEEIDYLLLLRSASITAQSSRKEFLFKKIDFLKKQKSIRADYIQFDAANLQNEISYLLNPLCSVIHVALNIPEYQKNPQKICSYLGITSEKLKDILDVLQINGFIELGTRPFEVKKVKPNPTHFGREHPLTRMHQSALKSNLQNRLNQSSENLKESFFVTFSLDDEGFLKIQNLFKSFIKDVQSIHNDATDTGVYQLNFDFLKWF